MKKMLCRALPALACVLLLSGCAGTVRESVSPVPAVTPEVTSTPRPIGGSAEEPVGTLTLAAKFQREDGTLLLYETVRIFDGDNSTDYLLDGGGALRLSGLSNSGEFGLSILDQQGQEAVAMSLVFTTGAVIDAMTDGDGVGHISLKEDTDEVALDFTWNDDGTLICSLHLSQPSLADA